MAKLSYSQKLLDPRWQKKRLEVLDAAEFQCEICGDSKSTLHVHHKQYIKGHEVWEYEREQLACLCETCHQNQHIEELRFQDLLSRIPLDGPNSKDEVFYLLAGFVGKKVEMNFQYQKLLYAKGDEASSYWRLIK
jgi:hypothetical protein